VSDRRVHPARIALYAFLALGLIYMVAPIAIVVVESFNSSSFGQWPPPGFSTLWYSHLFHGAGFGAPAIRSVEIALMATAGSVASGTLAALAIARYRFPGRRAVQSFVVAPLIVPKVAIGIAAFVLFLKLGWYGSLGSLILVHVVVTLPFVVTLLVAGFARVDRTLEEAAADLGARPRQVLLRATLPQMRATLVAAAAFSFIISFDELDASIFLVGQKSNTLPTAMFIYMQKYQDPTLAALSTLLIGGSLLAAAAIAVLIVRIGGVRAIRGQQAGAGAAALEEGV
jgi:ABC-type spermidine/putrescine transport system permease subunit II